jgi:phage gpG-like protein
MDKLQIEINNKISEKLDKFSDNIADIVTKKMNQLTIKLTNKIKKDKLSGNVLKVQTGRLRNSIHNNVINLGSKIIGEVSTNVKYAAIHEYGFSGTETVKAHLRKLKNGKQINIKSFSRNMNMPERSFMRSSLNEMKDEFITKIKEAVIEDLNK